MDLTWLFMETSIGNVIWHIFLGSLVAIIMLRGVRNRLILTLTIPVFMELLIDGAHFVNKNLTHNILVLWQIPLLMILLDYMYDENRKYMPVFLTIFGISLTHMFSDAVLEGDTLSIFYPFTAQTYAYKSTIAGMNAAYLGTILLLSTLLILYLSSRMSYSTSNSSSWPHRKEIRKYSFPSFITTVAFFILAL